VWPAGGRVAGIQGESGRSDGRFLGGFSRNTWLCFLYSVYTLSGIAEPGREIRAYRDGELQGSVNSDAESNFSLFVGLLQGANTLHANAVNGTEESLPYRTHTVTLDQVPPVITLITPTEGALVNYATFIDQLDEAGTVTVNGEPATVDAGNGFTHVLGGLAPGPNTATIVATDLASNSSSLVVAFTLDGEPPAPPDTAQVTVGAPSGGQVTVSAPAGAATPGDTVTLTNSRTGQSVQATVAADGSYSLQIGAQAGDEIVIVISDSAGNAAPSRLLKVAGTAPALALSVTAPLDGSSIADDRVGVSGTYAGPANVGIRVNEVQAQLIGNSFCAGGVRLGVGSNTLEVTATAPDGSTASQSVTVTGTGASLLSLDADRESGFAPLTITFSLTDNTGLNLTLIGFDVDGGSTNDYTTANTAETVTHTYNSPGCYVATVTAQDVGAGATVTSQQVIAVIDNQELEGQLLGVWYGMLDRLGNNDISGALNAVYPPGRDRYQSIFTDLQADLPVVADGMGDIRLSAMGEDLAEFQVTRNRDGFPMAFLIYMVRNADGIWQIGGM